MRRILFCFVAAIAASLLWALILSSTVFAADAAWKSVNSINYDGNVYSGPANEATVKNLGLKEESQAYTSVDEPPTGTDEPGTVRKIHVIYFESAETISAATSAKYKTLEYLGPASFINPSAVTDIAIGKQSATSSKGTSSCDVTVAPGISWIICPVTNFLANGMDWIFKIVSGFLTVRPVSDNPDTALFRAWSYMRSFANVAFVIAFLVIIYSQLTSVGISNYGIKKLLPRLIIAALLVNLSYYICAIAVDISNILGYSIQDVFINIRNSLVGAEGNTWELLNWSSITGFILSGGTAATIGVVGAVTTISTYGVAGSIFLLLPVLVSGLFAVLVALLVMSARQALITVLIVLSPLAFVAYLLPNTEKWFEKWGSTFMTMLILFPAFSVVFGGAQLASAAIIQNADSINMIILGMMVQVAPLMITPLLIKLGGPILSKIAGLVSSPNKGLIDRARKFTEDRSQNIAARRLGTTTRPGLIGAAQRNAQRRDHNRRRREGLRGAHTGNADARWANSRDFRNIDQIVREAGDQKALGEGRSELRYNTRKTVAGRVQTLDTQLRLITDKNADIKGTVDATYEIWKGSAHQNTPEFANQSREMQGLVTQISFTAESISAQAMRKQSATTARQGEFASALEASQQLRQLAGASEIDPLGEQRALAAAINVTRKAHTDTIANASSIIERGNLTDDATVQLALGHNQVGSNGQAIEATEDMVEAAIARIAGGGNVKAILELMDNVDLSPTANEDYRTAFTKALGGNSNRPKFAGFGWLGLVNQGVPGGVGAAGIDALIVKTINDNKFSAAALVSQDQDVLQRTLDVIDATPVGTLPGQLKAASLQYLKDQIAIAHEPEYIGQIGERETQLNGIDQLIP